MTRHLCKLHASMATLDQACRVFEVLEGDAQDYLNNKLEPERDDPEKVFTLLSRKFGSGCNSMQVHRSFAQRGQRPDEDVMHNLDALESLRNQGHPKESHTDRLYEILQRFIEGFPSHNLRESTLKNQLQRICVLQEHLPPTTFAVATSCPATCSASACN